MLVKTLDSDIHSQLILIYHLKAYWINYQLIQTIITMTMVVYSQLVDKKLLPPMKGIAVFNI